MQSFAKNAFEVPANVAVQRLFQLAGDPSYQQFVLHVLNQDRAYDKLRVRLGPTELAKATSPVGAVRRPDKRTYSDWKLGKTIPDTDKFSAAVSILVDFLLALAKSRGHEELPSRDAWRSYLNTSQTGRRSARVRSGVSVQEKFADWCFSESRRHKDALARLPYLDGHPDPTGHNITAHTRIGLRRDRMQGVAGDAVSDRYTLASDHHDVDRPRVEMSYAAAVSQFRELILLGDAGSGKTWLLHHHAIDLATSAHRELKSGRLPINQIALPVLIRADALAEGHVPGGSLADAVIAALKLSGSTVNDSQLESALKRSLTSGRTVFLIDALDETTADHQSILSVLLVPPSNKNPATRFVATSRLANYTADYGSPERTYAELLPFADPLPYVDSWQLAEQRRGALLERLDDPAIAQMARIPLLLAFLCHLASDAEEPLPETRAALYERITRRFLSAENHQTQPNARRAQPNPLSPQPDARSDELLDTLRPLAFAIATDVDGWANTVARKDMLRTLKEVPRPYGLTPAATLALLAGDTGILTPTGPAIGGRMVAYRFIHRTIAEYLVASHMAESRERITHCANAFLHLAADWRNTWLLTSQLNPTDTLDALVAHPKDMLHQALTLASAAVHEMSDEARLPVVPRIEQITRSATDLTGEANSIDVQEVGLVALAQVGGSSAITALGMQLTRTSSVQIADYIAGKIWEAAQRPDPGNASALERILSDGLIVWSSRSAVFQAIASLPRSQARDTLRHLVVGHLEDNIRLQAAKWLLEEPVASADPADLHVVADAFRSVLNQGHRWSAYEAIMFSVNLEHPIGVELLKETARTHTLDSRDRERLTDALRMSLSSDELVALLHDPDVESATLASYTALDTHGAFYPRASLTRDELLDIIGAVSDRNRPARSRCAAIGAIARQPWLFQGGASNEVSTKALSALTVAMTERLAGNLVRQCAAGAIAAMGGDEAAKVLIDASIQSEFKAVRAAANEALGHLVGPLAPSVMEALGELLQHRSSPRSLRCGLARTLSRGGGEVARGALLRAVGDESSDLIVRRAALKALGDFRRSQFSRVHDREVVDAIIEAAVVPAFTRTAMSALLMRCGPDYLPALAAIERVLREPTSTAASRQSAARALGRLGADRDQTVAALRRVLIDSGLDTDSRVVAAKVLGGLGSPLAAESLILGLRVPGNGHAINEAIAFEVYRTFNERRQDTRFIAALKNAAADPNLRAVDRMSIANTLRYIGELDENALATLRTSLTTAAKGNEAARAAAMTLGSMRDRATLTELLSAEGRPGDLAHMRHYVAGWQFGPITTDEPQDLMNLVVKATNSSDEGLREAARSIAYQRFTRITLPPRLRSPALLNMLFELS